MATNTGSDFRRGSVLNRSQFYNPHTGRWMKRDLTTGHIMAGKADGTPWRGVARERDGRR